MRQKDQQRDALVRRSSPITEAIKTNEKKLTKKEEEFCRWFSRLQNPREAAVRSGFTVMPEYRALSMLSKRNIAERIRELEKENRADENLISAGFKRLAFGSCSDAVKLILACKDGAVPEIDSLDLFGVSEIKYTCGKGMEIKFFDRLKALEKLSQLSETGVNAAAASFYEALERSAADRADVTDDG